MQREKPTMLNCSKYAHNHIREEDSSNQMQAGTRKYDNKIFVKKVVQLCLIKKS
ncbi:unnamed protein product [Tenebrio molitor]|nr:unnamed protein product [Tenebrio molitor]